MYRRMHKKGITEEVAKKRSRRTVKHQRGIVGADLAAIAARRNQSAAARAQARTAAIQKAKAEKKAKEEKKEEEKVRVILIYLPGLLMSDADLLFFSTYRRSPMTTWASVSSTKRLAWEHNVLFLPLLLAHILACIRLQ